MPLNQPGPLKQLKQKCYVLEQTGVCSGGTQCKFSHNSVTSQVQLAGQMGSQQMGPPHSGPSSRPQVNGSKYNKRKSAGNRTDDSA